MSAPRRKPEAAGFGHQGGSNLADYLNAAERSDQIELEMDGGERLVEIPVDMIERSLFQARASFNPEKIKAFGEDIRANGLNHPVTVREAAGGRYELVAGERRWLAAQAAGQAHVLARVRQLDDFAAHLVGVSENNRRANLSPWEMSERSNAEPVIPVREPARKAAVPSCDSAIIRRGPRDRTRPATATARWSRNTEKLTIPHEEALLYASASAREACQSK